MELDPKDARRRLQASPCEFAIRIARVEEHSNGGRRGNYLVQQLQPFRRYLYVQLRRARDIAMNQIGYQCRQSVVLPLRPPPFDRYVAALNVTGFAQPLSKCGDGPRVATLGRTGVDDPHHRLPRLLRARRERPPCRTAERG